MSPLLDPARARRWPWLLLSLLCILPAGAAYLVQFARGLRGVELLEFAAAWAAIPLAAGLIFLFVYLNPQQRG